MMDKRRGVGGDYGRELAGAAPHCHQPEAPNKYMAMAF
jgi:hypothetical protein